jgi:hypothetical protein
MAAYTCTTAALPEKKLILPFILDGTSTSSALPE